MAIIYFVNRKNKTIDGMKRNIDYITKDEKTENKKYVYGKNCDPLNAFEDFCLTKQMFGKISGRQHIHFTQSFHGNEASPDLAFHIAQRLLEHPVFKGFQVVAATHTDTDNIHNHFVINTVNMETGKKWKLSEEELQELKDYSDELCDEYSLEVIDDRYKTSKEYRPIWKENSKQYELYKTMRNALLVAKNENELANILSQSRINLYWEKTKDYSKNEKLESIIHSCKYHAMNENEFAEDLKKFGVDLSWEVYAIVTEVAEDGEIVETEKRFDSSLAYRAYVEEMKECEDVISYTDKIVFRYEGEEYTPGHFLKNMRYEGEMLRNQFQVNYLKDEQKPLVLMELKNSDEYKDLTQMIKVARQCSLNQAEFIKKMEQLGVCVNWKDTQKYITFELSYMDAEGKGRVSKYRNNRFFPRKSYTKEAFEEVFSFNRRMLQIIREYQIDSYRSLQDLAISGLIPDLKLDEKTGRVHLKIEVEIRKQAGKNDKITIDQKPETEIVSRECYFDKVAIERFLADENRSEIILPEKKEILKKENTIILLETEEGYLYSSTNLSKKLTREDIEQRFLFNTLKERKDIVFKDIQSILYCSYSMEDFKDKLQRSGYNLEEYEYRGTEKGKKLLPNNAKVGDKIMLFTDKENLSFASTVLWSKLTKEYMQECFEKNREYENRRQMDERFNLFANALWFFETRGDEQDHLIKDVLSHRKLEGQALRDYLKDKGVEL